MIFISTISVLVTYVNIFACTFNKSKRWRDDEILANLLSDNKNIAVTILDRNVISVTFLDQINALLLKHRGQWKIRLQKHLLCGLTTQKRILYEIKNVLMPYFCCQCVISLRYSYPLCICWLHVNVNCLIVFKISFLCTPC